MLWGELNEITHVKHLVQCFPLLRVFKLPGHLFLAMENFLILFLKAIIYEQILRTVPWNKAFRVCLPENDRKNAANDSIFWYL